MWKEDSEERSTILTHGIKLYPKNVPANLMTMDLAAYMTTTVPGMCVYVYIDMMRGA